MSIFYYHAQKRKQALFTSIRRIDQQKTILDFFPHIFITYVIKPSLFRSCLALRNI